MTHHDWPNKMRCRPYEAITLLLQFALHLGRVAEGSNWGVGSYLLISYLLHGVFDQCGDFGILGKPLGKPLHGPALDSILQRRSSDSTALPLCKDPTDANAAIQMKVAADFQSPTLWYTTTGLNRPQSQRLHFPMCARQINNQ